MTNKETEDFAHYFMTFLYEAKNSHDSAEVANLATDMVKQILSQHKEIRHVIWQYNQQEYLDDLGLDYGSPK